MYIYIYFYIPTILKKQKKCKQKQKTGISQLVKLRIQYMFGWLPGFGLF